MIAASVKDGDAIVDTLLQKGADVNQKSKYYIPPSTSSIPGFGLDDLTGPCAGR